MKEKHCSGRTVIPGKTGSAGGKKIGKRIYQNENGIIKMSNQKEEKENRQMCNHNLLAIFKNTWSFMDPLSFGFVFVCVKIGS